MSSTEGLPRRTEGRRVVPTYRHLLSPQAMTPANPLRTIAHCDIDAAYAQFEQVRLGLPDDIPLICAQWNSIIAVNYPARKYGIKRFTTIDDAKKACPDLIVQHVATYRNGEEESGYWDDVDPRTHKVSLDVYRRESLKILAIFREMIPKGEIEKASIDEAFLDLTPMVIVKLLETHPYLANVPDDAPNGLDSPLPLPPSIDWSKAGNIFPVNGEDDEGVGDGVDVNDARSDKSDDSGANGGRHDTQVQDTWEDWALCMGGELMSAVREEMFNRLHYTCTAGISRNKSMSKLCSAWKKPNNQTILRNSAIAAFLRDRDFTDIRSLGGKLGAAIAAEFDVRTVGDMLTIPLEDMQKKFGEESVWIYNVVRGIDNSEVKERVSNKSMLASKNIRPAVTRPEQGHQWLSILAGELNVRLRESRENVSGLWPKTLVLSHRQGIEPSRSRQTPFPFTKNLSTEYILKYAGKLWDEATQPMAKSGMKLNNIGLSFTGLEKTEEGQQGIEGFFANAKVKAASDPSSAISATSKPSSSTKRLPSSSRSSPFPSIPVDLPPPSKKPRLGASAPQSDKAKVGLDQFLSKQVLPSSDTPTPSGSTSTSRPNSASNKERPKPVETRMETAEGTWICPKCQSMFSIPEELGLLWETDVLLQTLKQEHEDWHFAKSLQGEDGGGGTRAAEGSSFETRRSIGAAVGATSGGKKKKKPEGIKAFFTPKPH